MKMQKLFLSTSNAGRLFFIGLFVFAALALTTTDIAAQEPITGEWFIDFNRAKAAQTNGDKVTMNVSRRSAKDGFNNSTIRFTLAELQGLTMETLAAAKTNVSFKGVREAGTFLFEGYFDAGKGAGFWTLVPNQNFILAMKNRGFDNLSEKNLFFAALRDLTNSTGAKSERHPIEAQTVQKEITGTWTAEKDGDKVKIHISRQKDGFSNSTIHFTLAELQGLTMETLTAAKTDVSFKGVREAGTFLFEGYFKAGKGTGFWTLVPNQNFVSAMKNRGFDNLSEKDLFFAALSDLNIKLIEDLKSAGYDHLSFDEVLKAAIFKINKNKNKNLNEVKDNNKNKNKNLRS